jgi:hypothetical protein
MSHANVILAGAQKSGTSALAAFLARHPECVVSRPKEPNFFSRAANLADPDAYDRCFAHGRGEPVRVDATTTYLADPEIPARIARFLGDATKVIVSLRSPVARTYSGYLHMLKRGHERRMAEEVFLGLPEDAEAAADAERKAVANAASRGAVVAWPYRRLYDDVLWNYRYLGNSLYAAQLAPYWREFGEERVLVLIFEEVFRRPDLLRERLGRFLGLYPEGFPDRPPVANATRIPRLDTLGGILLEQARWLKRGNYTRIRPGLIRAAPPRPSAEIAARLRAIFSSERAFWQDRQEGDLSALGW